MKLSDKIGVGVLIVGAVGYFAYWQVTNHLDQQAANKAGFVTAADYVTAKAAGFSDPAAWAVEKQRRVNEKANRDNQERERTRNPATLMKIMSLTWSKEGFGVVAVATFTIENMNDFPVKDIVISCDFKAASGTVLGTRESTVYETIKAKSSRTFREVNLGFVHSQATKSGCAVDSAKRM